MKDLLSRKNFEKAGNLIDRAIDEFLSGTFFESPGEPFSFIAPRTEFTVNRQKGYDSITYEGRDMLIKIPTSKFDADKLKINLKDSKLVISGEKSEVTEKRTFKGKVVFTASSKNSFKRTLDMPKTVTSNDVEAEINNEELIIRVKNAVEQKDEKSDPTEIKVIRNN